MSFTDVQLETDYDALLADAYARLAVLFPGWVPSEASLEAAILAEQTRLNRETAQVATNVGTDIFRAFGTKVLGFPSLDGSPAEVEVTITATDNAGYTLPAGFAFAYRVTGDELVAFVTTEDAVIPPLSTSVAGIAAEAVISGIDANGIVSGSSFEPVDSLAWIASIVSTSTSAGGSDAETDTQYLNKLAARLTLLADRPILPDDFAILALWVPGVYRARALDGYNPDDETTNNEKMVSVAALDVNGEGVTGSTKTAIEDLLEDKREQNFAVRVIDPTYTDVAVVFVASSLPGYDDGTVETAAEDAVAAYLDPARWGGGDDVPPVWRDEDTVSYLEVASVINAVEGIDVVSSVTLNGLAADLDLDGPLPLPSAVGSGSTVSGSVS